MICWDFGRSPRTFSILFYEKSYFFVKYFQLFTEIVRRGLEWNNVAHINFKFLSLHFFQNKLSQTDIRSRIKMENESEDFNNWVLWRLFKLMLLALTNLPWYIERIELFNEELDYFCLTTVVSSNKVSVTVSVSINELYEYQSTSWQSSHKRRASKGEESIDP